MTAENTTRPCRCLTADMPGGDALARIIRERTEQIPEAEQTPESLRLRRLDACRECGKLNRGTCALCGCYVEIRAARRRMDCPDVPPRWPQLFPPNE